MKTFQIPVHSGATTSKRTRFSFAVIARLLFVRAIAPRATAKKSARHENRRRRYRAKSFGRERSGQDTDSEINAPCQPEANRGRKRKLNMATVPNNVTDIQPIAAPQDSLVVVRNPNAVLREAIKAAEALKKVITAKPKQVKFNGETYLENEDWLTIARFYGVTSRIRSTRFVSYGEGEYAVRGWEAIAEAYLVEREQVVSMAESMCLSDEPNWQKKPLFQLRSMAQTRASSRVLRQVLGWVGF